MEHGLSLEAQRVKLTTYSALYELDLVAVEVDAGASAKTLQGPALQQVLIRLKTGEAEALLVVKLDRLTRFVRDLAVLVETYFLAGKWLPRDVHERAAALVSRLAEDPELRVHKKTTPKAPRR